MKSQFDPKDPSGPAYTFGISRSFYDKVYCEATKMLDKNIPGPGKYDYLKKFGSDSSKYSMSWKFEDKALNDKAKNPAPGDYSNIKINKEGKYPLSQYENTNNIVFGQSKEQKSNYRSINIFNKYSKGYTPGPERYKFGNLIDGTGFLYVSKFKSSTSKSMSCKLKDPSSKHTYQESNMFHKIK